MRVCNMSVNAHAGYLVDLGDDGTLNDDDVLRGRNVDLPVRPEYVGAGRRIVAEALAPLLIR